MPMKAKPSTGQNNLSMGAPLNFGKGIGKSPGSIRSTASANEKELRLRQLADEAKCCLPVLAMAVISHRMGVRITGAFFGTRRKGGLNVGRIPCRVARIGGVPLPLRRALPLSTRGRRCSGGARGEIRGRRTGQSDERAGACYEMFRPSTP